MQYFKAKKKNFWIYIVLSLLFPIWLYFTADLTTTESFWLLLPAFFPVVLFIWIGTTTKYSILEGNFHYQSAFLKGKIAIASIKKIKNNTTMWSGVKPAMASKGMIITYGYNEVYVAPESNELLIEALTTINPLIILE